MIRTAAFHKVFALDKDDWLVSRLLERAETLDELMELVPDDSQPRIIEHLYTFYKRGQIDIVE
jgi:hypothetical protein